MATRAVLLPESAHYPATNFPALLLSNRRPVLAFDASTSETAYWTDSGVPGTAGYMEQVSVTLTNADSIAAADLVRVSVARAVANGADTATGDCYVLSVEIRDAA